MPPFDVVLHGGKVVSLDRGSRIADAIGVRGGRIDAVGATAALLEAAAPATRVIDLRGRTVVPGFFDGHPHMDREGLKACGGVPVAGLRSIAGLVDAVAGAVKSARPGEWVVLMPMGDPPNHYVTQPAQLTDGRFPTRHDLDAVSPDNPVYVRGVWGWWSTPPFPSVANSEALRAAGITRDTPAPYNCEIVKDERGEPTGIFLERNRAPVLEYTLFQSVPRFTYEDRRTSVRTGSRLYSAAGTTSGYEGHGMTPRIIRAYRETHEARDLTVRMYAPVSIPSASMTDTEIAELFHQWASVAGGRGMGDGYFHVAGVTLDLADARAAELIGRGYPDEQWAGHFHQGLSDERFVRLGVQAVRLGLRLNTLVCYGAERAIRLFEAIDREASIRDLRCVGIHLMTGTDDQLRRIRDLGLVLTMTPNLLYEHAETFHVEHLREDAIPIRRVLDAGIPVCLATDNVPYSMLWTMWQALARASLAGHDFGESHLTREEALRLSVQTGHYLTWSEDTRGSLEAGKVADLVVLADDPLTCPLERLCEIRVDLTMSDGRIVYERP